MIRLMPASLNQKKRQQKRLTKTTTIHKVVTQKPTITHEEEKVHWFSFSLVALLFGLCFNKQHTMVLKIRYDFKIRQHALQNLIHFCKSSFTKSYVTLHYMVHVSINSVLQYSLISLIH